MCELEDVKLGPLTEDGVMGPRELEGVEAKSA